MTTTLPENLIRDINRRFTVWLSSEIYVPGGDGLYVPNVNDLVIDYTSGLYRVSDVDLTTSISTLVPWDIPDRNSGAGVSDALLGAGPGPASEAYHAYINRSVVPYTLAINARLHLYGTTNRFIKVFQGTDTSQLTGKVISQYYDQSGTLLGENIPLELVAMEDTSNVGIQTPVVGYTMNNTVKTGEKLAVVVYDDAGVVRDISYVTAIETGFVRSADASKEYITDISIESPYLSSSDPTTLEIPMNMVVQNIPIVGLVTYSSGKTVRLSLDGTKFAMLGLENYIATRAGQTVQTVLTYAMSAGELSYNLVESQNGHLSKRYQVRTASPDLAYSVKLFAYPQWVDAVTGYTLKFYLTNLERTYLWDVTDKVTAGAGSRAFDPIQYGVLQRVTFMINLADVSSSFAAYHHVETFEFNLSGPPDALLDTTWTIGYEPNQNPPYGLQTYGDITQIALNVWNTSVASGATTLEEWLEKLFYRTVPLFDVNSELKAPMPTHFYLRTGTSRQLFPITQWNSVLTVTAGGNTGDLMYLEFIKRLSNNDLYLGISGLPTRRT